MAVEKLEEGVTFTGLLVDELEGTPFVGASLFLDPDRGVTLTVPFMGFDSGEGDQFASVREWFFNDALPPNLIFMCKRADFALFDVRSAGWTTNMAITEGTLRAGDAVAGLRNDTVPLTDPLEVRDFYSQLKGLFEWSRLTAATWTPETDEAGRVRRLNGVVETVPPRTWQQGEAVMTLTSSWSSSDAQGLHVNEWTVLKSSFPTPQPPEVHLAEHRKVQSFLVMMVGKAVPFAKHQLKDEAFAHHGADGTVLENPFRDVVVSETVNEHQKPAPIDRSRKDILVSFNEVDVDGLQRWASHYESWGRFILPAVGLLSREGVFAEDRVSSLAMSLEAAGNLIGEVEGERETYSRGRPSTKTWFFRCFTHLRWDCSAFAETTAGLACAVADNYNTIKHFNRGDFPHLEETTLVGEVVKLTVRSLALKLAKPDHNFPADGSDLFRSMTAYFRHLRMGVKADGQWVEVDDGETPQASD